MRCSTCQEANLPDALFCAKWISASAHAAAIEAALRTAETLAQEIGLVSWLPWVYEERAALALALRDKSQRRDAISAGGHVARIGRQLSATSDQAGG